MVPRRPGSRGECRVGRSPAGASRGRADAARRCPGPRPEVHPAAARSPSRPKLPRPRSGTRSTARDRRRPGERPGHGGGARQSRGPHPRAGRSAANRTAAPGRSRAPSPNRAHPEGSGRPSRRQQGADLEAMHRHCSELRSVELDARVAVRAPSGPVDVGVQPPVDLAGGCRRDEARGIEPGDRRRATRTTSACRG